MQKYHDLTKHCLEGISKWYEKYIYTVSRNKQLQTILFLHFYAQKKVEGLSLSRIFQET